MARSQFFKLLRGTSAAFLTLGFLAALTVAAAPAEADIWGMAEGAVETAQNMTCPQGHCGVVIIFGPNHIALCGGPAGFTIWVESDSDGIRVYHPSGLNSGRWDGWCY